MAEAPRLAAVPRASHREQHNPLTIDRRKAVPKDDRDRLDVRFGLESVAPQADGQWGRSQRFVKRAGARFAERLRANREFRL